MDLAQTVFVLSTNLPARRRAGWVHGTKHRILLCLDEDNKLEGAVQGNRAKEVVAIVCILALSENTAGVTQRGRGARMLCCMLRAPMAFVVVCHPGNERKTPMNHDCRAHDYRRRQGVGCGLFCMKVILLDIRCSPASTSPYFHFPLTVRVPPFRLGTDGRVEETWNLFAARKVSSSHGRRDGLLLKERSHTKTHLTPPL